MLTLSPLRGWPRWVSEVGRGVRDLVHDLAGDRWVEGEVGVGAARAGEALPEVSHSVSAVGTALAAGEGAAVAGTVSTTKI